jgi:hypothetical protein
MLLMGVALPSPAVTPGVEERFVLRDQFGREAVVLPVSAGPVVILYSDRAGTREARAWLGTLAIGGCILIEVAQLAEVPAVARPFVRRSFRNSSAVLLDWRGRLAARLGFQHGHANLYLFDSAGRLSNHYHAALGDTALRVFSADLRIHCNVDI